MSGACGPSSARQQPSQTSSIPHDAEETNKSELDEVEEAETHVNRF